MLKVPSFQRTTLEMGVTEGQRLLESHPVRKALGVAVEALLEKYNVAYVYVGRWEREKYGSGVGEEFESFMDVAFENEGVTIYKVIE